MGKKLIYSIILVVVLMGFLNVLSSVHKVEAQSATIYIRADGSIDPFTPLISSTDNITYSFTDNINASIVLQRSNIIIDGDGYTLTGPYTEIGFNLTDLTNVTIRNVNVVGFGYGIYLQSSTLSIISGNNITFNEGNIYLENSSGNTITNNTITDGAEAIQLYASPNNTISGNSMTNNYRGVWLRSNSAKNLISGNNITGNYGTGIDVSASSNNTLSGNNVTGNVVGVSVGSALVDSVIVKSMNNTILGNNIVKNNNGIDIVGVLFTIISRNHIAENTQYGIILDNANNNTISANNITNNNLGIFYDGLCNNNTAYHNNFIENTKQVEVSPGDVDAWDDGVEGNYWSNYTDIDSNHDGIGDSWHEISENNTDHYPLIGPFHSFNTSAGKNVNIISNSTIESFEYEPSGIIRFYVSNMTSIQTHGFCRVSIPYEVLSKPFNVTINGADPTYWNYTVLDNGTHRWIYFEYEHSTKEVIIIPEFPAVIIPPLFMFLTLIAVVLTKKNRRKATAKTT